MSVDGEKSVFCCRTCLSECFEYKYLHKKGLICDEITTMSDLLKFCTNVDFPKNEAPNLPEQICSICIKSLIKAVRFKKMVLENDKYLRRLHAPFETIEFSKNPEDNEESSQENTIGNKATNLNKNEETMGNEEEESNIVETDLNDNDQEHEVTEKLHAGKIEFITNELEHGNEFVALQYINEAEEEIENENMETTEGETTTIAHILPEDHTQYELQYIDTENDIDIVVDHIIEDELHEDIVEEYDEESMDPDQNSSEDDMQHYIKDESESADSYNISVENDDSLEDVKHFIYSKSYNKEDNNNADESEIIICDETDFKNKSDKEKNPKYQCKICNKQLSNAGSFKYHMQLHSDKTPFLCSLCGEGFKTRNAYEGHLSTHNPNNPNTCEICGKRYRQAASLRAHMVVHTGEKPFQCEICGKGLTQKSGYKKHLLTHQNEKPHSCDICGREFRYSSNLLAHKRTHETVKRLYKCSVCSKPYNSLDNLRRHKLSHSLLFQCSGCPKRFKTLEAMESHRDHEHCLFGTKSRSNIIEML